MAAVLRVGVRVATGCRLVRASLRMADQVHQPLVKRQRLVSARAASSDAASAAEADAQQSPAPAVATAAVGQEEPTHPGQEEPTHPSAGSGNSSPPRKKIVMPTPVQPPTIPLEPAGWENAVLLIDKPKDWTSFDVCGKLRGMLAAVLKKRNREVKVGHAGTLDPMATGLLIVCVGRGTKAVDAFMAMEKQYSGTLRLGEATPSYDAETPVEERLPWEHITDEELLRARDGFVGNIQQMPPMYSAIKVGGQKLYEAARKGKEVERQPRAVTVERFGLWRDEADAQSVHFRITCSKGTYIRSLAFDLGRAVGSAAHLTALRREAIGEYSVEGAWDIQQLAQQLQQQKQDQKAAAEAAEVAEAAAPGAEEPQVAAAIEAPAATGVAAGTAAGSDAGAAAATAAVEVQQ